jgi:hypothetical protein
MHHWTSLAQQLTLGAVFLLALDLSTQSLSIFLLWQTFNMAH